VLSRNALITASVPEETKRKHLNPGQFASNPFPLFKRIKVPHAPKLNAGFDRFGALTCWTSGVTVAEHLADEV